MNPEPDALDDVVRRARSGSREALLRFYEGATCTAIGERLGLAPTAAANLLVRAVAKLRHRYRKNAQRRPAP